MRVFGIPPSCHSAIEKKNLNGKRLGGCRSTIESCCNILSLAQFSNLYEGVWLPSILPFSHCKKQLGGQLGGSMVEWRPPSCLPFKTMAQLPFPSRRLPISSLWKSSTHRKKLEQTNSNHSNKMTLLSIFTDFCQLFRKTFKTNLEAQAISNHG